MVQMGCSGVLLPQTNPRKQTLDQLHPLVSQMGCVASRMIEEPPLGVVRCLRSDLASPSSCFTTPLWTGTSPDTQSPCSIWQVGWRGRQRAKACMLTVYLLHRHRCRCLNVCIMVTPVHRGDCSAADVAQHRFSSYPSCECHSETRRVPL